MRAARRSLWLPPRARLLRPVMYSTQVGVFPRDYGHSYIQKEGTAYVKGPNVPSLMDDETVWSAFEKTVGTFPGRDALRVCNGEEIMETFTYSELHASANLVAHGLAAQGLAKGDRLGVWLPNTSEWLILQLATAKIGVILVNVNPAYRTMELEHALNLVGCKALVITPTLASSDYISLLNELMPEIASSRPGQTQSQRVPSLRLVVNIGEEEHDGILNFRELLTPNPKAEERKGDTATLAPHEAINIQFTSGTTGAPKGATLTHHNIVNNGYLIGEAQILTETDSICIPVPLYHCFGMVLGNMAAITHGACLVYPADVFSPAKTLECVAANKCTALYGVPAMFNAELNLEDFDSYDLSSLRTGIMAGSPCPIDTMNRVMSQMHMKDVTIAYGMTETSPVSFQSRVDDPVEKRCETVGRIMPHTECKVVREDGSVADIGEAGELWTRGYLVMKGYWGNEKQTTDAIEDGWMKTGDVGSFDEEGYMRIGGRIKDVVIRGGENLFPKEIEDYLHSLPHVREAEVVGVPDERYGEALCAFVVPNEKEFQNCIADAPEAAKEEIKSALKNKISHFKIPQHIIFYEGFDKVKTVTGKVMKKNLREIARDKLGISK